MVSALEALHEEAKPLGLKVSWTNTKVQAFGGLLGDAVRSVHACGEDIEVLESFTYLGSVVHNNGGSDREIIRRIGLAHGGMNSLNRSVWRCRQNSVCQTSAYSVKPRRFRLPAQCANASSGYIGTCHDSQMSTPLIGFSLLELTLNGGGLGDVHVTHG